MEWLEHPYVVLSLISACVIFIPAYIRAIKVSISVKEIYESTLREFIVNEDLIKFFMDNVRSKFLSSLIVFFKGTPTDMTPFVKDREVLEESFALVLEIVKILNEEIDESNSEMYNPKEINC